MGPLFDTRPELPASCWHWRETRKADRASIAKAIEALAAHYGARCDVATRDDGTVAIDLALAGVACGISLRPKGDPEQIWMLWHTDFRAKDTGWQLDNAFGAAAGGTVNPHHRRKCSAWASNWNWAMMSLALSLDMLATGEAFIQPQPLAA